MWTYFHHGLVPTEGQQHARTQLIFSQREQELLGLIAGTHQNMNLEEMQVTNHNNRFTFITVQDEHTHHTGKELAIVIAGHTSWTVELKPAVFT